MRQAFGSLSVRTQGAGLYDITPELRGWIAEQQIEDGLLTIFIQHTSASLTVQENADPDVLLDLDTFMRRIAPEDPSLYRHTMEGADDMPAHIRSALTLTQLAVPVSGGRMTLGTWQAVYVFEHRAGTFSRRLSLHLLGE